MEGFLCYKFGVLIFGEAYFRNFMVFFIICFVSLMINLFMIYHHMVLFLSLTQVISRLIFSASPLIYWYTAYVIISDSTEPPYRHCPSKLKSQLILGYFLLYFFIGTVLHCNFYPWT